MENKNAQARRYLREVRSWLPNAGKLKRSILREIGGNLDAFLAEKPEAAYGDIVARFGDPQQIAASYVDETETDELLRNLRVGRRIVKTVTIGVVLALTLWAGVVSYVFLNHLERDEGFYTREIIVTEKK